MHTKSRTVFIGELEEFQGRIWWHVSPLSTLAFNSCTSMKCELSHVIAITTTFQAPRRTKLPPVSGSLLFFLPGVPLLSCPSSQLLLTFWISIHPPPVQRSLTQPLKSGQIPLLYILTVPGTGPSKNLVTWQLFLFVWWKTIWSILHSPLDYGLHEDRDMLGTVASQSLAHCCHSTNTDGCVSQGTYYECLWTSYFLSLGLASFLRKVKGFDFIKFLSCYKLPRAKWEFLLEKLQN